MDKVTQVNIEGHSYGFISGNVIYGSCASQETDWTKNLSFSAGVDAVDGMFLAIDFTYANTAGTDRPVAVYSSDGVDFYYDQAMTDPVTLPPQRNYTVAHVSGTLYSLEEYPVMAFGGNAYPLCNARGKPCGGSNLWNAGDTVVMLFSDGKCILLSMVGIDTSQYSDAPLGSYMPYGGTTDPADKRWLVCDGRDTTGTDIELETYYPSLYTFLGGTNVLPDLRNKTFMGANPASQASPAPGNQSDVGEVQAAQLPKVVGYINHIQSERGYSNNNASGAFTVTNYSGQSDSGTGNDRGFRMYLDTSNQNASADHLGNNVHALNGEVRTANVRCNWIIKAVDRTDTAALPATAVMQLAQHMDNGVAALNNKVAAAASYSYTEHPTGGNWVDGKPIYARVIQGTFTSGTSYNIPFSLADNGISEFVSLRVRGVDENGAVFDYYQSSTDYLNVYHDSANSRFVIRRGSTAPKVPMECLIFIEYTKTSA